MGQSRKRTRFLFWLYPDTDSGIINSIDYLKGLKNYSFVQAIRDGLRLIVDLRAGKTKVLFELFPHLRDKLHGDSVDDSGNLKRDIERLERLILQNQARQDTQTPIMKPVGLKGLQGQHNTVAAPLPIDDDDSDDENLLEVTKATGNSNANSNFLKSMLALQH